MSASASSTRTNSQWCSCAAEFAACGFAQSCEAASGARSLPADAEEVVTAADDQAAVGDGRRRGDALTEIVLRQLLVRRTGLDDVDLAHQVRRVNLAVDQHRRRRHLTA